MQEVLAFILENADDIAIALLAAYGLAEAVAKITPTLRDDAFMAKLRAPVALAARVLRKNSRQVKSGK